MNRIKRYIHPYLILIFINFGATVFTFTYSYPEIPYDKMKIKQITIRISNIKLDHKKTNMTIFSDNSNYLVFNDMFKEYQDGTTFDKLNVKDTLLIKYFKDNNNTNWIIYLKKNKVVDAKKI